MPLDCLCTGILVADHLCTPIARFPEAGQLVLADELPLTIGGCAANTAINLARLGITIETAGCVGDDAFGRFISQTLKEHGVGTAGLRALPGVGTSGTLIINVQGQDRRFIHAIGANGRFRVEDIPRAQALAAKVLYVGGYLLMSNFEQHALVELFGAARKAGVKTVLDVVLPGRGDYWNKLSKVLAETDVFLPNIDEAAAITGLDDPVGQAERFLQAGVGAAVITCGGDGTVLLTSSLRVRASAYPTTFVGGTGAGDAFDAGYIVGLLNGEDPLRCLHWGSALGASCVRAISATQSVFTRDEAEDYMRRHELRIDEI